MIVDPFATRFNPPYAMAPMPVFWLIPPFPGQMIETLKKNPRYKNLAVAIVDLTGRTRRPDGAGLITATGWNMFDQRFAASLVKIAPLVAAFRLRHNLRIAANQVGSDDRKEVFRAVEADWKDMVQHSIPTGKPNFPIFDKIFTISGSRSNWTVDFTDDFADHQKKMIVKSDNRSASICIDRLGNQYINGCLATEGLYDPLFGGLWKGGNYAGRNWMKEPRTKLTHVGATAKAVATYLTLLEQERLIDGKASQEMKKLRAGSWFYEGLQKAGRAFRGIFAKVGAAGTYHDCAIIERTLADGNAVRYAAVCLGAKDPQILRELIVKLDDHIVAANS